MNINYIEGDLFGPVKAETGPVIIAHCCNDKGAFGAGFVIPLARHFPKVKDEYLKWSKLDPRGTDEVLPPFELGNTQFIQATDNVIVANMVAQTLGGHRPLYYNHLSRCLDTVAERAKSINAKLICPAFGSNLAGGDWTFIEQLVIDSWIKQNLSVEIYYLPGTLFR